MTNIELTNIEWQEVPTFEVVPDKMAMEQYISGNAYYDYGSKAIVEELNHDMPDCRLTEEPDLQLFAEHVASGPVSVIYNLETGRLERIRERT